MRGQGEGIGEGGRRAREEEGGKLGFRIEERIY
jgi:hypothetical protein